MVEHLECTQKGRGSSPREVAQKVEHAHISFQASRSSSPREVAQMVEVEVQIPASPFLYFLL